MWGRRLLPGSPGAVTVNEVCPPESGHAGCQAGSEGVFDRVQPFADTTPPTAFHAVKNPNDEPLPPLDPSVGAVPAFAGEETYEWGEAALFANRSPAAMGELYRRYRAFVLRLLAGRDIPAEDQEELVQDVIRAAFYVIEREEAQPPFQSYLYRVTQNHLNTLLRRLYRKRRRMEALEDHARIHSAAGTVWHPEGADADLEGALARLDADEAHLVRQRYLEGRKMSELDTPMSENTARAKLNRALGRLREFFQKQRSYEH